MPVSVSLTLAPVGEVFVMAAWCHRGKRDGATRKKGRDRWPGDQADAGVMTRHSSPRYGCLTVKEASAKSPKSLAGAVRQAAITNMFMRLCPRVERLVCYIHVCMCVGEE